MAKDLRDILGDDRAFESVLTQAMEKVGRERDKARMEAIGRMDEEEFRAMLGKAMNDDSSEKDTDSTTNQTDKKQKKARILFLRPVFLRVAAACAAIILIIGGINHFNLGRTNTAGYASLFNTYYKGDKVDWQTFDAGEDRLNTANQPSTAALLERSTKMLSKKTDKSTREGIRQLEHLLTLNYKASLEHEIRWYLGLGYMRNGQINEAINEFERVITLQSPHAADAQKLCKELTQIGH